MNFELQPDDRKASDEDLLADLRRVAADTSLSHVPWRTYVNFGRFGAETIRRRFGSWNAALSRAGLSTGKRGRIPDDELYANIEQLWRSLGRQPRRADLDRFGNINKSVYDRRFRTWRGALESFVVWVNASSESSAFPAATTPRTRRSGRQPSLRMRFRVMQRDGFKCVQCGRSPATHTGVVLHVDHIIAWAAGGETSNDNLRTLCQECNLGKSSLPVDFSSVDPVNVNQIVLLLDEAAAVLRADESQVTALIESGHLAAFRVANEWRIPSQAIINYLASEVTAEQRRLLARNVMDPKRWAAVLDDMPDFRNTVLATDYEPNTFGAFLQQGIEQLENERRTTKAAG